MSSIRRGARRRGALTAITACLASLVVSSVAGAAAFGQQPAHSSAPPTTGYGQSGGSGDGGNGAATPTGNDVSYPQCGRSLPKGQAFGIVGVDDGIANVLNPCLGPTSTSSYAGSELYWAVATSTGTTSQPKASLYVNTADPGDVSGSSVIADWPTSGTTPDGNCTDAPLSLKSSTAVVGANSPACAWQYGYDKASQDAAWLAQAASSLNEAQTQVAVPTQAASYVWWLDVETSNTWQSGSSGRQMNVADLQGMVAALQADGVTTVGIYAVGNQWTQITGGDAATSGSLGQLPAWVPGATGLASAETACATPSFTGGHTVLTQWVSGGTDDDYACPA